jgi:hypothetical protein
VLTGWLRSVISSPVTEGCVAFLRSLTGLQRLDLHAGICVTDSSVAHLRSLILLQHLNLGSNPRLTGSGFSHLRNLTRLQHLDLHCCTRLTDSGVAYLRCLIALQHLNLFNCERLTDRGVAHLSCLTSLQHLDLRACHSVTDSRIAILSCLTSLQYLDLRFCRSVSGSGVAYLQGCGTDGDIAHIFFFYPNAPAWQSWLSGASSILLLAFWVMVARSGPKLCRGARKALHRRGGCWSLSLTSLYFQLKNTGSSLMDPCSSGWHTCRGFPIGTP